MPKAFRSSLWTFLAVVGACRLAASASPESAPLLTWIGQPVTIPTEVNGLGMFVSVMINGQGPFRLEIDTGCSFSMISPEVAAAVEARGIDTEDEEAQATNALGDLVSIPRVLLDSVSIGGVSFQGVMAGVVPLDLQSKVNSRALDGLLGYSLFADLFFALDYPNQALMLSKNWPENLPPVRTVLPITEYAEVPFVPIKLQDKGLQVMIDTGANDRVNLPPAMATSLNWKVEPRPGALLAVAGEDAREQVGRLSGMLELGQVRQENPVVAISEGLPNIGMGLLHSFCLVFHEAEDKVWLCSPQDGLLPSPPERSVGLSLFAEGAGWRVAGIIPNSPAEEAAINEGDLVTRFEGQPALTWTRDQIQNWIDSHATLALRVSGKTGERDLNLRVWSLVP